MSEDTLLVYEIPWVIDYIYEVSDGIRNEVVDQTLFEERCIKRISEYLGLDEGNKKNKRYITRMIREVASAVKKRNRKEFAEVFTGMTMRDDGEDEIEFEPEDPLAGVEDEVIANETIALLAQDDQVNQMILDYWTIGNTDNTHISRSLARTFGGNEKSLRVGIYRFRESCREKLATAI